jgi:uncharacterized membrane protein YwaF
MEAEFMSFIERFFGYFSDGPGDPPSQIWDGLGNGAFEDWRHYAWMVAVIIISVALFQVARHKPKLGKILLISIASALFIVRLVHQTYRGIAGVEVPWFSAFPWHMCTVLTFVLPIVIVFDIKVLKQAVYMLSIMGGIITVLVGDYFVDLFLPFSAIEGISAHTLLIALPIMEIGLGTFKFKINKYWEVIGATLILMAWATLANEVIFKGYDTNYMYLRHNGLPANIGGDYYILVYVGIFLFFSAAIYGSPLLYNKIFSKTKNKESSLPGTNI